MRALLLGLALGLLPRAGAALQILRLPWIFSDEPELSADFNFSAAPGKKTRVELSLGGRFARFGLPRGAARAPILETRCEFVSPGELVDSVASLKGSLDLSEVLKGYGAAFSRSAFSGSSPYVFKSEYAVALAPGDYNVIVSIRDKELSISSRRTLHVIVPAIREADGLGDLKFLLGVGEELDARGKKRRILDPNPWRQLGGASGWDLIVAYDTLGEAARGPMVRRHSVWRLRGDNDEALWSEEGPLPAKRPGQVYLARLGREELATLRRGIYVFKVEAWPRARPSAVFISSKTFEVLP